VPVTAGHLSRLIALIYDAAVDPGQWPATMEAVRLELDAANATLNLFSLTDGQVLLNLTTNISHEYVARIPDYGAEVIEQWGGQEVLAALPIHEPAVLSRVNPVAINYELTTNRYSLEWARPQGLIDVLAIGLARDHYTLGSIAFGRSERAGRFGEEQIELARLLVPHFQRAATINRLLEMSDVARHSLAATIDALSTAILLVDGELSILHANAAATDLLNDGNTLFASGGRLIGRAIGVTSALSAAVVQGIEDPAKLGRQGLGIPIVDTDGVAGALYVLPLQPAAVRQERQPSAAIFYARQGTAFIPDTQLVEDLFGLTPAEAKVFDEMVRGSTMAEAARNLGIAISTVKTHLLRTYSKTGLNRQADLAQLARSLTIPLRP